MSRYSQRKALVDLGGFPRDSVHPPQELADEMHAAWVEFITHGTTPWPSATAQPVGAQVFNTATSFEPVGMPSKTR
jgi:hypothetical protein